MPPRSILSNNRKKKEKKKKKKKKKKTALWLTFTHSEVLLGRYPLQGENLSYTMKMGETLRYTIVGQGLY